MGLADLKARAFARESPWSYLLSATHCTDGMCAVLLSSDIVTGLDVSNIPYEAFSAFSAAFDEVRKVEVDFFLKVRLAIIILL